MANIYSNFGNIMRQINKYKESIAYYHKCIKILKLFYD
jgi:hypothetical protein